MYVYVHLDIFERYQHHAQKSVLAFCKAVTLTYTKSLTYQELNYFPNAWNLFTVPVGVISFLGTFNLLILVTST